jgi:hypothetical protein
VIHISHVSNSRCCLKFGESDLGTAKTLSGETCGPVKPTPSIYSIKSCPRGLRFNTSCSHHLWSDCIRIGEVILNPIMKYVYCLKHHWNALDSHCLQFTPVIVTKRTKLQNLLAWFSYSNLPFTVLYTTLLYAPLRYSALLSLPYAILRYSTLLYATQL